MTGNELDSWSEFTGASFIKAENVANEEQGWVVESIGVVDRKDKKSVKLELTNSGQSYFLELNQTNAAKCRESGIKSPNALIGKKLYFKKVAVTDPKTRKEVQGLRIYKID